MQFSYELLIVSYKFRLYHYSKKNEYPQLPLT
nr:MAG TPA: hypothetical protein [Crassvirales sp.]